MAFSDLCHINNAYKTVENEVDQSERIMEENSMVRDLITKILDETGPADGNSSVQTPEKTISGLPTNTAQFPKNDTGTSFVPPPYNNFHDNMYNFGQNEPNGFNFSLQNGFGNSNGFVNYPDNDINPLLGVDTVDTSSEVTPEQLNLLRLAAQEIGGAQFTSPNKFDEKYYNFFEPNQRNSLPEMNMLTNNFNRPNSLHLDMSYNSNFDNTYNNIQRYSNSNKFDNTFVKDQDPTDILTYLNQLNISLDRPRDDLTQNMDFKMPLDLNGPYQNEDFSKMQDERSKMFYNRNFQQMPPKNYNGDNFYFNDVMKMNDRSPMGQNYDFSNQTPVSAPNSVNYKPNGFHQNDFMQRRDMNQMIPHDNYQGSGPINGQRPFDNAMGRDNIQQAVFMRQNQEFARQMGLLMRNRQPPNQLNIDVSFLHENTPFNLGLGALLGPSPPVQPPVLPSPMLDLPLLAPFYAMRNMRGAATASGILHARLDACYEQWRQLERERKRTEARLALAYPGRAVSSSNSIPVPRLPPCPTRVDRLTVDMLREHTKVLTLMGKMETLRASVCVAQNKKANKPEDCKITVLKRGQENVPSEKEKEKEGVDPTTFDPSTWREDVKNLAEIAPHSEVESAMLSWRNAVAAVQAARRRELAHAHAPSHAPPAPAHAHAPSHAPSPADPILQLAEAVKQLCSSARRARCAMWCDLTLTVALAPRRERPSAPPSAATSATSAPSATSATSAAPAPAATDARADDAASDKVQATPATQTTHDSTNTNSSNSKQSNSEAKEEKTSNDTAATKNENKNDNKPSTSSKGGEKQEKSQQRRAQNYRHKVNQRNDFYQKNQRYDNRFMQNRHPYYLATGPIN